MLPQHANTLVTSPNLSRKALSTFLLVSLERETKRERREKEKTKAKKPWFFLFVGETGQLSNRFVKDLLALNALLGMIGEV